MTSALRSFVMDGEHVTACVDEIRKDLGGEGQEVLLDFFLVQSLDPAAIRALEALANAAATLKVRVVLRGVNVEMYKVLKLANLTNPFVFID